MHLNFQQLAKLKVTQHCDPKLTYAIQIVHHILYDSQPISSQSSMEIAVRNNRSKVGGVINESTQATGEVSASLIASSRERAAATRWQRAHPGRPDGMMHASRRRAQTTATKYRWKFQRRRRQTRGVENSHKLYETRRRNDTCFTMGAPDGIGRYDRHKFGRVGTMYEAQKLSRKLCYRRENHAMPL